MNKPSLVEIFGGASQPQNNQTPSGKPSLAEIFGNQASGSNTSASVPQTSQGSNQAPMSYEQANQLASQKGWYSPGSAEDPLMKNNKGVDIGGAISGAADFLSNAVAKPIARVPLMAATAVAQNIAAKIDPTRTAQDAAAPVDLPWVGNVNPISANTEGNVDIPNSLKTMAATGGEGVIGAMNLTNPTLNVGTNILRSGAQSALHEAQNPTSDTGSIAGAGITGGATAAILGPVFNKIFGNKLWSGKPKDWESTVQAVGQKVGLLPADIKNLANMSPEDATMQAKFLKIAKDNVENADQPTEFKRPMQTLADQVTTGMKKLMNLKNTKGGAIGATKQDVMTGAETALDPKQLETLKNNFTSELQGPNTRVNLNPKTGNLDFSGSTIEGLPGDEKILSLAWDKLKNAKTLDDLMAAKDTIANHLNFGKSQGNVTAAEGLVKKLMYGNDTTGAGSIRGVINKANPNLGELNDTFHELSNQIQGFAKKTKVNLSSDSVPTSGNMWNILRRSLGNTNQDNADMVANIEKLGHKYNIPELKDLQKHTWMAQRAEDLVGTDVNAKPTSMGSILSKGKQVVQAGTSLIKGKPLEAAANLHDLVRSNPNQLAAFEKLLSGPKSPTLLKQIVNNPIVKLLGSQVQKSLPIAASSTKF